MSDIIIRQAELADVPAICRIETESYASPWSAKEITKDVLARGNTIFAVAEADGEVAGFAEMRTVADEAQIYSVAVDPAARGRGTGEALMRHMIKKAEEGDCSLVTLEVRSGNAAALSLYKKLGFREVGRRSKYYGGKEDAVLMDLDIAKVEIEVRI